MTQNAWMLTIRPMLNSLAAQLVTTAPLAVVAFETLLQVDGKAGKGKLLLELCMLKIVDEQASAQSALTVNISTAQANVAAGQWQTHLATQVFSSRTDST